MNYEKLLDEADSKSIDVYEVYLAGKIEGLYKDGVVWIKKGLPIVEKGCVLAEEIGHYETSVGDILDQTDIRNKQQELRARQWGYQRLIPLSAIVQAYQACLKGRHEIADYLNVTEKFLQSSIDRYRDRYGLGVTIDNKYIIYFDPLGVVEMFDDSSNVRLSFSRP